MTAVPPVLQIRVARPCPTSWAAMAGDERVRFCSLCSRKVYNFSALTTTEAEALLRSSEGRVCGLLFRRHDGTLITADCPVGRRRLLARVGRRILATAAGLFLAFGGRYFTPDFKQRLSDAKSIPVRQPDQIQPPLRPVDAETAKLLMALGYIQ